MWYPNGVVIKVIEEYFLKIIRRNMCHIIAMIYTLHADQYYVFFIIE